MSKFKFTGNAVVKTNRHRFPAKVSFFFEAKDQEEADRLAADFAKESCLAWNGFKADTTPNLKEVSDRVIGKFVGAKYQGESTTISELKEITGLEFTCYDAGIDDGADDDETEDKYVMKACFSTEDDHLFVRVYYGDVTGEIGYVDVAEC